MKTINFKSIRSYVGRNSRITDAQQHALDTEWSTFGLSVHEAKIAEYVQNSRGKLYVEIGFGSGVSLLAAAKAFPDDYFIGIEPHKPGVGAVLLRLKRDAISNVRVFSDDAVLVLQEAFPDHSIDGIHIFFPDPWQKRKHHARRLIQTEFTDLMCQKLKSGGHLHIATDWQDYATHIAKVLESHPLLMKQPLERSPFRPIVSKFEARSIRENRITTEFQFFRKEE